MIVSRLDEAQIKMRVICELICSAILLRRASAKFDKELEKAMSDQANRNLKLAGIDPKESQ